MSGAVAAHASYNGSGTQGLAVTNKISDANQGDVVSVFWNETDTTRQLLYGSSTLEVPTSGSGKNASWGGSQIFTVNNDIDCLGDMYLSVTVDMNTPTDTIPQAPKTSLTAAAGGFYYIQNDGATNNTSLMAKEAAAAGLTWPTQTQGNGTNVITDISYDTIGMISGVSTGPGGGVRTDPSPATTNISLNDAIKNAVVDHSNNLATDPKGYFKKLSPGESHAINAGASIGTFQTTPPNGWAWVGDDKMQILGFSLDDLSEMVKYYNDKTYLVWGWAEWATGGGGSVQKLALVHPADVGRPEGGVYMTLDDAVKTFDWYQQLVAHAGTGSARTDLTTLPPVADIASAFGGSDKPHWSAAFREVPVDAILPVSGEAKGAITAGATQLTMAPTGGWGGSTLKSKVKFPLAKIVKRIEFQVGTQIWQTLEYNDLLSINATEIPESSYNRLGLQTTGYVKGDGSREAAGEQEWTPGKKYQAFIPLPMLTKTLGPQLENFTQNSEDGYLMAAAPHQNVKIKVHYSNFGDIWDTTQKVKAYPSYSGDVVDVNGVITGKGTYVSNAAHDWAPTATLATKLYAQHMIMCNEEREQMKNMPNGIPKRLKMTQNVNTLFPSKIYPDQPVIVDLDHFSLYGSHLIISADFPGRGGENQKSSPTLKHAELKLNSSSYSGLLDGQLLKGITNKSLGLYANDFTIDKQHLDSGMGYYVFPLAARSFGGASVPLNRFDNIRLSLTFNHPEITSSGHTIEQGTINVTCVGETTGLYKGGAASLAMY